MEYNSKEWKEVTVILKPSGKAPKKYGGNVYRFSAAMTLGVILPRRGWQLIKKAKNYAYFTPPADQPIQPFSIKIKIPNKEQALEIANQCFAAGESWMGQIGEWPAWYLHKRQSSSFELVPSKDDERGYIQKLSHVFPPKSSLTLGEYRVWSITLENKEDGEFNYRQHGNIEGEIEQDLIQPALSAPPKFEGQILEVEETEYERNPIARKLCIEHYGASCQVCSFDFFQMYGDIGHGFIHVHHTTPISTRGGQYEINPITDLIPLCPNCHAMVHRRNPPYTIEN
ncbi:HNH endonuclease [Chitinophaga sp. MD30]|uniref:HNH endonuclease n=1 Tax=Chitinophaga sp. MD30 TaxID=2033437 RepID=UPI0018DFED0C|nr:HNH endonuclease [Chitinophaga sp. MD30]